MINLYLWFDDGMAYWLGITPEMAENIMLDFEKSCGFNDYFIES